MARVIVQVQESGERIDALLARSLEGMTRSAVQRLLDEGASLPAGSRLTPLARDILEGKA